MILYQKLSKDQKSDDEEIVANQSVNFINKYFKMIKLNDNTNMLVKDQDEKNNSLLNKYNEINSKFTMFLQTLQSREDKITTKEENVDIDRVIKDVRFSCKLSRKNLGIN